jgi:hypothetical protein
MAAVRLGRTGPIDGCQQDDAMPLRIQREQVWSVEIADRLGSAAAKLEHLGRVGARPRLVFTYPHPTSPEKGILYVAPITGPEQMQAAREVGLGPALDVAMLHIQGEPRPGIDLEVMSRLAVAGLCLRGMALSTTAEGLDAYLAFDSADTAALAVQVLATLEGYGS